MPRGIKVDIDNYIANIKEYLEVGCSIHEACLNGEVPYRTVMDYYEKDDEVRKKIDRLMNTPILAARKSLFKGVLDDPKLALSYLERKKKDEFSLRSEVTGKDGGPVETHALDVSKLTTEELLAIKKAKGD